MDIETTTAGKLKLTTLLLGGLSVGLTGPSLCTKYFSKCTGSHGEKYFMAISCIALSLSLLMVLAIIFGISRRISKWGILDTVYHILMAVLLTVGWIVFVINVNDLHKLMTKLRPGETKDKRYTDFMARRSFALIFQLINICVYLATAFFVGRRMK